MFEIVVDRVVIVKSIATTYYITFYTRSKRSIDNYIAKVRIMTNSVHIMLAKLKETVNEFEWDSSPYKEFSEYVVDMYIGNGYESCVVYVNVVGKGYTCECDDSLKDYVLTLLSDLMQQIDI